MRTVARLQPAVGKVGQDLFKWPIITQEDEDAVVSTLRNENLSGTNITREFEVPFSARQMTHTVAALVPAAISLSLARARSHALS